MSESTVDTTRNDQAGATSTPEQSRGASSDGWRRWLKAERWENSVIGLLFGADLRSLALLRMAMALIVIMDISGRLANLKVHYSDEGIMPRSQLVDSFVKWRWSVNLINDTWEFQGLLMLLTIAAAIAMMLGYRTRVMVVLVWVLVVSLQVRNPFVLSGADTLLRVLLFWCMFLPLGAVWSLDARNRRPPITLSKRTLSFATVGIFLQICFMYWFTAILKDSPEWRTDGTALYYALGAGHITKPFGEWLHQFPELLRVLTHASLALEVLAPIMLFIPFWNGPLRTAAVASVMAFHMGIFLTMDVGIFPWTSALCMLCFLPTWFWDSFLPRVTGSLPGGLRAWSHRLESRVQSGPTSWRPVRDRLASGRLQYSTAGVPDDAYAAHSGASTAGVTHRVPRVEAAQGTTSLVERAWPITNLFMAGCLVLVLVWNLSSVSSVKVPSEVVPFGYSSGLYQRWNMFAPSPSKGTVWIVVRGVLADGREMDLLTPMVTNDVTNVRPLSWDKPDNIVGDYYGDKYWRKYITAIGQKDNQDERRAFAAYACRTWNAHYGGDVRLAEVQVFKMTQRTLLDYEEAPVSRSTVAEYRCR